MEKLSVDIVSDLHIDQWDPNLNIKYKCGEVKDKPIDWSKLQKNEILIIAGDVSDDLNETMKYLDHVSQFYKKILFVDGNHEHVNNYPDLYSKEEIKSKIKNEKVVYLTSENFILNGVAFIGSCGWWDHSEIKEYSYFKDWIPHLTKKQNEEFCLNVKTEAIKHAKDIEERIKELESNNEVNEIVVVTHCVPLLEFCDKGSESTELNKNFTAILNKKYSKLKSWVFGHTHQHFNKKVDNVLFRANGRGRPEDWNRETYDLSKL